MASVCDQLLLSVVGPFLGLSNISCKTNNGQYWQRSGDSFC